MQLSQQDGSTNVSILILTENAKCPPEAMPTYLPTVYIVTYIRIVVRKSIPGDSKAVFLTTFWISPVP